MKRGAVDCLIRAVYAPNVAKPLDVQVEVDTLEAGIADDEDSREA